MLVCEQRIAENRGFMASIVEMSTDPNKIASSIVLHDLELKLHLGWSESERLKKKQVVVVDIKLDFIHPPKACTTDNLYDTICYDKLISEIESAISPRKFLLLEHLGHEIYKTIKNNLNNHVLIAIKVKKKPAIENLKKGVSFYYGDKDCVW